MEEPYTFKEVVSSPDAAEWQEAMESEMHSHAKNGTWELMDLPEGRKPIKCKWLYKVKYNQDGSIEKFKARLVAKGYSQVPGVDFKETFSPTVRFESVRFLLALAAAPGLELHQVDIKTAFLNGDVEEELYMEQPEGYVVPGEERKVCRIRRALYGLKQAPRQWYQRLEEWLVDNGFNKL